MHQMALKNIYIFLMQNNAKSYMYAILNLIILHTYKLASNFVIWKSQFIKITKNIQNMQ